MIVQIVDFALFFMVLFFLVPGIIFSIKALRGYIHQNRKHAGWHKNDSGKIAN